MRLLENILKKLAKFAPGDLVEQRLFKHVHNLVKRMEPKLPKTLSTRRALQLKFGPARK